MTEDPIITPIGAPKTPKTSAKPQGVAAPRRRSFARDIDGLVFIVSLLTAVATFALSAYFFYGFTQTDQGFWTLASAFGLCFGVGSLAYVPSAVIASIARRCAEGRASRKSAALGLLLLMPWVFVALIFIGFSTLPKLYGVFSLFLSTGLSVWALSRLRQLPKT